MNELEPIQIIDQNQNFNSKLESYINKFWNLKNSNGDYKILSIIGSQSSGKSTLLNGVFGTNFDIMKEDNRQQTTKGIWMSKSKNIPLMVLDVEGADGRERGDDQSFERKSTLFSLAISQVILINIWEHSIGLYNGANMILLKTVFEVNLQLFNVKNRSKALLLFVIRDYLGNTPLYNLESILKTDMEKLWNSLSKPKQIENCQFSDFFDLEFVALSHRVLQEDLYKQTLLALKNQFYDSESNNYLFKTKSEKTVPIDGLNKYISSIWDIIKNNKDLDIPTQQELLSQFRCSEISSEIFVSFNQHIGKFKPILESGETINNFKEEFETLREKYLVEFVKCVSRYSPDIAFEKKDKLLNNINLVLKSLFDKQLKNICNKTVLVFKNKIIESSKNTPIEFITNSTQCINELPTNFSNIARESVLSNTNWSYDQQYEELTDIINESILKIKNEKIKNIITDIHHEFQFEMGHNIVNLLNNTLDDVWLNISEVYNNDVNKSLLKLTDLLEVFRFKEIEIMVHKKKLVEDLWDMFIRRLREEFSDNLIISRLRLRFDNMFKYDINGLLRIWKPDDDIDRIYKESINNTKEFLDIIFKFKLEYIENLPNNVGDDLVLINEQKKEYLYSLFSKDAELMYIQSKRSTIATKYYIPSWIIGLLVLLGWDKLMIIISNPLYLTILILMALIYYSLYALRLFTGFEAIFWMVINNIRNVFIKFILQIINSEDLNSKIHRKP